MRMFNSTTSSAHILVCLLIATLLTSGCSESVEPAQRLAVSDSMEKFKAAMIIPYQLAEGESFDKAQQRYINTLRNISVSDCPEDFQRAWNEHLAEVVQARSVAESLEKLGEIMESGDLGEALALQREANRDDEAAMKLWRVAAKYDRASARFLKEME